MICELKTDDFLLKSVIGLEDKSDERAASCPSPQPDRG